ncbi:MAG: peptidylprolyl isomerase [Oscillospiraceae bacterium]|nr:peptidylprolyl isomerase [Oscillospiraceae bacterium]
MGVFKKKRKESWMGAKENRGQEEEKKNRQTKFWTLLISIVLIVACVALAVWSSGVIPKNATAVTIGSQNYSAGVVQFYYQNAYKEFLNSYGSQAQLFGLDTSKALDKQKYDEKTTWADYFLKMGLEKMERTIIVASEARKANFSLTKDSQNQIGELKENIKVYCVNNNISTNAYFSYYGDAVTAQLYYDQVENTLLAQDYTKSLMSKMKYTDQELTDSYNKNQKNYDVVGYRFFLVDGSAASAKDSSGKEVEATDKEKEAAMAKASEKANAMAARLKSGADFTALAKEYAPSDKKETYANAESSTISDMSYANVSSYPYADWLFDTSRKNGDVTAVKASNGYYVIQFLGRHRNEYKTADIRQIVIKAEAASGSAAPTSQQMAEAKAKAESLLGQWKKGAATEAAFASMAKEHTEDSDAKENGGLSQQVNKTSVSSAVSSWLFGSPHKAGDASLIETDDGYSIVYFVKYDEVYWKLQVEDNKKSEAYTAWYDKVKAGYSINDQGSGMRFVI